MAKRPCPLCAEQIEDAAIKCRYCGGAVVAVRKGFVFPWKAAIGITICLMVFWVIANNEENGPKTHSLLASAASVSSSPATTQEPRAQPATFMDWRTLLSDYNNNEVAADAKYKGKRIRLFGKIHSIGKAIGGDPYVTLGEAFKSVNFYFDGDASSTVATLSKGSPVVMDGECHGITMGSVVMKNCTFPSEAQIRAENPEMLGEGPGAKKKRRAKAESDE